MNAISFILEYKNTVLAVKLNADQQQFASFIYQKRGYCQHLMSKLFMRHNSNGSMVLILE